MIKYAIIAKANKGETVSFVSDSREACITKLVALRSKARVARYVIRTIKSR